MRKLGIAGSKRRILFFCLAATILLCLAPPYFTNKKRNKILLIGLDGASWKIITPLVSQGKLPNIKHLLEVGCQGKLETLENPLSDIVWTTVITGKSPELHGITSMLMADPYTKELIPPNSNLRKVKALWNILSGYRKKVGIVSYRVSWPAEKVNGIMISDRAGPGTYFSSLYAQPPFSSFCTVEMFRGFRGNNSFNRQLREDTVWIFERDNFMTNVAEYLYKNNKFDFFCLYLVGIDGMSHYYWKYMFPDSQDVSPDEISRYKDVISDYYIWCDSVIGKLLRIADNNTTVIIVSDHGFMTKDPKARPYVFSKIDTLLEAAGIKEYNINSKEVKLLDPDQERPWEFKKNIRIIGDISEQEFNAVRENAKNVLKNVRVEETGVHLFHMLDDTQAGFIFEMDRSCAQQNEHHILIGTKEYELSYFLTKNAHSGWHDPDDAIIIMSGKNIRQRQQLKNASIYDITPTLLHLLDLPVAKDMQGNVLTGAIDPKFLEKRPARYVDTYENKKPERAPKPIRSPEDEKIIKERMRSLGYIN